MSESVEIRGPDFVKDGLACSALEEGKPVAGQANGEAVLVIRRGEVFFAVGAACTHYGAPLAEGIVEGGTIRCRTLHRKSPTVGCASSASIRRTFSTSLPRQRASRAKCDSMFFG